MSIRLPMKGRLLPVVLGYDSEADYEQDAYFMGATVGRVAGRIKGGRFLLNGRSVQVQTSAENNGNCLHGGTDGLHAQRWTLTGETDRSATYHHLSPDGACGFPGALAVTVRYSLGSRFTLFIELEAQSTADTVVNLTNHAYFNLSGESTTDEHSVWIDARRVTPLDQTLLPIGDLRKTAGTAFDFSEPTVLGRRSGHTAGVDLCYVLNHEHSTVICPEGGRLFHAATVYSELSKVRLAVHTTQPALQFYTGHYLDQPFGPRQGLCLEAQGFPDAPNNASFPSIQLAAGQRYRQVITYDFSVGEPEVSWPGP